jgi:hypothetical protein
MWARRHHLHSAAAWRSLNGITAVSVAAVVMTVIAPAARAQVTSRDPQVRETETGMALARSLVLSPPAEGWRHATSFAKPSAVTCQGFEPNQSMLVETGLAATIFTHAKNEEIVESVRVFETEAQAGRAWKLTNAALRSCERQTVEQAGEHVKRLVPISLQLGTHATAFRIVAWVKRGSRHVPVYNDLVLVRNRAAVVLFVFISANRPYPRASEGQLARRTEIQSRPTAVQALPA